MNKSEVLDDEEEESVKINNREISLLNLSSFMAVVVVPDAVKAIKAAAESCLLMLLLLLVDGKNEAIDD